MPSIEEQIKEGMDGLKKDFENYKEKNDAQIQTLSEKKTEDPILKAEIEKRDKAMDKMEKNITDLTVAIKRQQSAPTPELSEKQVEKKLTDIQNKFFRGGRGLTDDDVKYIEEHFNAELSQGELKTLSVDNLQDGGFFVRPELLTGIRSRRFETSPVMQFAETISTSSNSVEFLYDDDEPDTEKLGERQAPTDPTDNNEIRMVEIQTHIRSAQPRISQTLMDDANFNVEQWHAGKVQQKFGRDMASDHIIGTGVGEPRGILSYPDGPGTFNTVEQIASGAAAAVTDDGFIDCQNALFEEFQGNARWMMKRETSGAVRKLKDGFGRYIWQIDNAGIVDGAPALLLGKPVHFATHFPSVGAGALAYAYGDFRMGYMVVDRIGIRVLRDPFTSKPFIKFYTTKRDGGGIQQFQALKIGRISV